MKKNLFNVVVALAILFVGCSKDDDDSISLKATEKTLYHGDDYQIEASSSAGEITYVVENDFHAKVTESGLVTARFVGETNILLSNGKSQTAFKVIVQPESTLYPEPFLEFGATRSVVKSKMGIPAEDASTYLRYNNYSIAVPDIRFTFNSSDKLSGVSLLVKTAYTSRL